MDCIAFALRDQEIPIFLRGWVRPAPNLDEPREVPTPWGEVYLTRRPVPIEALEAAPLELTAISWSWICGFGRNEAFALGCALGLYGAEEYPEVLDVWGGPSESPWLVFDIPRDYVLSVNQCSMPGAELVDAWLTHLNAPGYTRELAEELWELLRDLCNQPDVKSGESTLFIAEMLQ